MSLFGHQEVSLAIESVEIFADGEVQKAQKMEGLNSRSLLMQTQWPASLRLMTQEPSTQVR